MLKVSNREFLGGTITTHKNNRSRLKVFIIGVWVTVMVLLGAIFLWPQDNHYQQIQTDVLEQAKPTTTFAETEKAKPKPPKVRKAKTVDQVLKNTTFVSEYRRLQSQITKKHDDPNLAQHGLDICKDAANPKVTVFDMVLRFMTVQHPHPGPQLDRKYPAIQIQALALQQICPDLLDEYARKGDV